MATRSRWGAWAMAMALFQISCSPAPFPPPVTQADAVAKSPAGANAKELAPQAYAAAEKLRAEAKRLHEEGHPEEAAAVGEEAIAAYNQAFALARVAQAEERIESAKAKHEEATKELARLDQLQSQVAADADTFEMRARVHLDKEEVKDVEQLTPERAQARRVAARQLAAEARLLCLAARLLDSKLAGLEAAQTKAEKADTELSQGSIKDDLYPRSAAARADCLEVLTAARRPIVRKAPESAASDRLLTALSETQKVFVFRDDRGIVVNLGSPLGPDGKLTEHAQEALDLLGGTAKAHKDFPLLLVAHTARNGQTQRASQMLEAATTALEGAGVQNVTSHSVLASQPVVSPSLRGAAEKNERLEVVFVVPGR